MARPMYVALHYDLHAIRDETDLGSKCDSKVLAEQLERTGVDFVQTDCKGHPGYCSWHSQTPGASVPKGLQRDMLQQWRKATKQLGIPLHCHYSGIWDTAAAAKHRAWCAKDAQGRAMRITTGPADKEHGADIMCPRSPYVDELMIPQMKELVERYGVDGFWIDGDLWAVAPCYCRKCTKAFNEQTGLEPPVDVEDEHWPAWWLFTLRSFEEYVTRYCDAVHKHMPGVKVCSNWLQTFRNPGPPTRHSRHTPRDRHVRQPCPTTTSDNDLQQSDCTAVPTDWISGDNASVFGLDQTRCEVRYLSTRGKPWDIMLWNFYRSHGMDDPKSPWTPKPVEMLLQEVAMVCCFGGGVQVYEHPELRDGRLVDWRLENIHQVREYVDKRRKVCSDTQSVPQVAVLHSEHHVWNTARSRNLMFDLDMSPVEGAVYALLECHYGVDVLDEWALLPRIDEFPVVVVPERHAMSLDMCDVLKDYVQRGGRLLVSGAGMAERLGQEFLGITAQQMVADEVRYVELDDCRATLYNKQRCTCTAASNATSIGKLQGHLLQDDDNAISPAAILNKAGKGLVLYVPYDIFRDYAYNRYPATRDVVDRMIRALVKRFDIEVDAPRCVDVVLRKKSRKTYVHLVNRGSGIPSQPKAGAVDDIQPAGPIRIRLRGEVSPDKVRMLFDRSSVATEQKRTGCVITVEQVHIHAAVELAW